jgi:uncharacterized protein YbaR (Trm112 family)
MSPTDPLLALLCCPVTRQPLEPAAPDQLAALNEQISPPLEAALIRADGKVAYPVRDGIPLLVAGEAIALK